MGSVLEPPLLPIPLFVDAAAEEDCLAAEVVGVDAADALETDVDEEEEEEEEELDVEDDEDVEVADVD